MDFVSCNVMVNLRDELDLQKFFEELKIDSDFVGAVVGANFDGNIKGNPKYRNKGFFRCVHVYIKGDTHQYVVRVFPKTVMIPAMQNIRQAMNFMHAIHLQDLMVDAKECMVRNWYKLPEIPDLDYVDDRDRFFIAIGGLRRNPNFVVSRVIQLDNDELRVNVSRKCSTCHYGISSTCRVLQTSKSPEIAKEDHDALLEAVK